ncbi:MAG: polyketide synthase, partial [Planctomycetes bacterium]|nr:polyketide synthase [Planctomycetota bacterium]
MIHDRRSDRAPVAFEPVAIIGLGAAFPRSADDPGVGGATELEAFWNLVRDGRSAARVAPAGRWTLPVERAYSARVAESDRVHSERACFLERTPSIPQSVDERWRARGVDPRGLDPSIALTATIGEEAFRHGRLDRFDPTRVGAIFGNIVLPTEGASAWSRATFDRALRAQLPELPLPPIEASPLADPRNRYVAGLPALLLAVGLGIEGPSFTLDAACASSLFALRLAARELAEGRLDAVIAGGVSRPDPLYTQMGFSQLRAVSPTGTCSPFDVGGNGLVVGEGGGLFALRRLADAVRDGDPILGVIRGVGLSNDVGGSLLAPDSEGQLRAMREAYAQAGWHPEDVDLIECHATGTPLGDTVEVESLRSLWSTSGIRPGQYSSEQYISGQCRSGQCRSRQCVIGSVKSNVGHLLTAAGAAGVAKVLQAFHHETLPATASHTTPIAALDGSPFRVLTKSEPFPRRDDRTPRRAAVSAFGFGGINAHLLIEEPAATSVAENRSPIVVREATTGAESRSDDSDVVIVGLGLRLPAATTTDEAAARLLGDE